MTSDKLVTQSGPLEKLVQLFEPNTWLHSDEITKERVAAGVGVQYAALRRAGRRPKIELDDRFYTADMAMYYVDRTGAQILCLCRGEQNLIFRNAQQAVKQIMKYGNYRPTEDEIRAVLESDNTLKVDLVRWGTNRLDSQRRYFDIEADNYRWLVDDLDSTRRSVAERLLGSMKTEGLDSGKTSDFDSAMSMLRDAGVGSTRIITLDFEYVRSKCNRREAIARICTISTLYEFSMVNIASTDIAGNKMRGVRRIMNESDAQTVSEASPRRSTPESGRLAFFKKQNKLSH